MPRLEVFLGHMGGPFWRGRDAAAWSIPKGTYTDEEPLAAALREFSEEVGRPAPDVEYRELGAFRYASGKRVWVFAGESDFDASDIRSNVFELEWPPRSGRRQSFPELDAAGWFALDDARERLVKGQRPALDALERLVGG
ncbi:NUDIX domain-containing protein [Agromyces bauzanensis]|uniref:DNA mismatch repair protein MutT n=2 Tax=Agromyces bauzanensis TaxID=1308924 RepID=A0A917UUR9_9MICO|nr:DNA mismatch repair protein MutT [Agromyces bauzanensis]